jgi:hypothetical protein
MQHIEQHILELFVLGSDTVAQRRVEIEAHLAGCHGCRTLVEQMEGSYRDADARFRELQERPVAAEEAMERVRQKPAPRYESAAAPGRNYKPVTRFQRVQYLVRRHPVIAGSGTFAVFALLALLIWMPRREQPKDTNPFQVFLNADVGKFEVLNRDREQIWELPASGLPGLNAREQSSGLKYSVVADLDGDGKNEVITTVPVAGIGTTGLPVLAVFSAKKEVLFRRPYEGSVVFRGTEYVEPFGFHHLVVSDSQVTGSHEIVVQIDNGRSTNALLRISGGNNIVGEYWHFGAIHALYAEDVNDDGKPELVACGQNDVGENGGERFAFLAVIDPAKITGKTESACTPGFGFARSQAELLYMRFPETDLNRAFRSSAFSERMCTNPAQAHARMVWFAGAKDSTNALAFEYVLLGDFACTEVKSTDQTNRLHEQLAQQGRVKGKIDSTYLENLRKGVRYFDGKEWRKEVVRMNPPS